MVNTLNHLRETGAYAEYATYSDIMIAFLTFKLAEAERYKAEQAA